MVKDVCFELLKAFGNFLITQQRGQGLQLVEIASSQVGKISTKLLLNSSNKASHVDSCLLDQMSYLRFTTHGSEFDFKKIH